MLHLAITRGCTFVFHVQQIKHSYTETGILTLGQVLTHSGPLCDRVKNEEVLQSQDGEEYPIYSKKKEG